MSYLLWFIPAVVLAAIAGAVLATIHNRRDTRSLTRLPDSEFKRGTVILGTTMADGHVPPCGRLAAGQAQPDDLPAHSWPWAGPEHGTRSQEPSPYLNAEDDQ